ncbi:MAG: FAD-dependent oxidoreductase [Phycisphaerae bacterium]
MEREKVAMEQTDVLVIGGGTAGAIAALQSARAGASTMIVESGARLGGTMTAGGVWAVQFFNAGSRQVIAGIGWEMVCKSLALENKPQPDFSGDGDWTGTNVFINGDILSLVLEEEALAAEITLHYHEFPLSVTQTEDGVWTVIAVGRGGVRREIKAKQLIDCTGDASVVGMLGLRRRREETIQPGTLMCRLRGYDPTSLDEAEIQRRYEAALANGLLEPSDWWRSSDMPFIGLLQQHGSNAIHVPDADSSTSQSQTLASIRGRAALLRLLRFVRTLPGCEDVRLVKMFEDTAARETFRITGEKTVTEEDYVSGKVHEDAVCYSFYPIDVHTETGVIYEPLPKGVVPTVPLGALVPEESTNLLAAGRTVSSDRRANSALRVMASCMAMGQAAGAAAALACRTASTPGRVNLQDLRELTAGHGAIIPPTQ